MKLGLTLAQLAAKVETDKGTMSRIERGLASLTTERLLVIAAALGVEPGQLLQPN